MACISKDDVIAEDNLQQQTVQEVTQYSGDTEDKPSPAQQVENAFSKQGVIVCIDLSSDPESNDSDDDSLASINVGSQVKILVNYDENLLPGTRIKFCKKFGSKGSEFGELQDATDIKYFTKGKVIVTDLVNSKLQVFSRKGKPTTEYIADEIVEPWSLAVTSQGHIAVTSRKLKRVVLLSQDGLVIKSFGQDLFQCPCGLAVDNEGRFIVTDCVANLVSIHDASGTFRGYLGNGHQFKQPRYVSISDNGQIIVSDSGNHCLKIFDPSGTYVRKIGKYGKEDGCLKFPNGVCTDNFGNVLVADRYNGRISIFTLDGEFVRHIITSVHGLRFPQAVLITPDLKLYVTNGDLKAHEVLVFQLRNGQA